MTVRCESPAPFQPYQEHARGYMIFLKAGVDVPSTAERYRQRYSIRKMAVYSHIDIFWVDVPLRTMAALRSEPEVKLITDNVIAYGAGVSVPPTHP